MHLGHYKHRKLDFDEINTNPQCAGCNVYGHGKLDVYSMKLIERYGIEAVEDLHRRAAPPDSNRYSKEFLLNIIQIYGTK